MSRHATARRSTKPLPAYGRELIELRRRGLVPARGFCNAHLIIVLDNWKFGSLRFRPTITPRPYPELDKWEILVERFRLVIAPDSDPAGLDFIGVAGLDVFLVVDSRVSELERRNAAIRAILAAQPASLMEMDLNQTHAPRYIKTDRDEMELAKFAPARFIKTHAVGIELKEFVE